MERVLFLTFRPTICTLESYHFMGKGRRSPCRGILKRSICDTFKAIYRVCYAFYEKKTPQMPRTAQRMLL